MTYAVAARLGRVHWCRIHCSGTLQWWPAEYSLMQYRVLRDAWRSESIVVYVQAIDRPSSWMDRHAHLRMLAVPNYNNAGHAMGILPLYVGMRVRLDAKIKARS